MINLPADTERLLDELGMDLVMADPEDLIALGEVLTKIQRLALQLTSVDAPGVSDILAGLQQTVEGVILGRIQDSAGGLALIGRGVGQLQEMVRDMRAGKSHSVDVDGFLTTLARLDSEAPGNGATENAEAGTPALLDAALEAEYQKGPDALPRESLAAVSEHYGLEQEFFFNFLSDSTEQIETIELHIITLEQNPDDWDALDALLRPMRTIKAVAGFLNLKQVHGLTHSLESILEDARDERLQVNMVVVDLVLDAVDLLKHMMADLTSQLETGIPVEKEYHLDVFFRRLEAVRSGDLKAGPAMPPPASIPGTTQATAQSAAPASAYAGLKIGEILIDQQVLEEEELDALLEKQEDGRLRRLGEVLVDRGVITAAELEDALERQLEATGKKLGEILVESGRVAPEDIDRSLEIQEHLKEQKLGEMLIKEGWAGAREITSALRTQKKKTEESAISLRTVKVDTAKLDLLVDMVGELVIAQSLVKANEKVLELKDQKLQRDMSHMGRITSELQRIAMSMRMVPIRQTFQKMTRLVRDLSRKSGKSVELEMSGEDTEIDRNMVEAIYDPLVHMVRNSVDHGIEPPMVRKEKGKPVQGKIRLMAYHQGGNVVIEIRDDGQGLNREKIWRKAVERGVISPEESLSEAAVFNLIFQPGFSTAETVTDVSGRGVGMDVVKKAIEKLRGKVELSSTMGQGSKITIRLPLTLAIIDGMIVRVGQHRYILPTVSIHESFRPEKEDYHTVKGQGEMIKVRQQLLPLVRLDRILETQCSNNDPTKALVIVVENNNERRCIMVDEVVGKQEVVIKSLGERLKHIRALAGGSILGDGRVGLILDVAGMFEASDLSSGGAVGRGVEASGDWGAGNDWNM